jgi:hypothetical protein
MTHYTKEYVESSYQFKVIKRVLFKEFTWIKNISIYEEYLDKYTTMFLIAEIDPIKFCDVYNVKISKFFNPNKFSVIMNSPQSLSTIFDIDFDEGRLIENEIDKYIQYVKNSPIPDELMLDRSRRGFALTDFLVDKNELKKTPQEYFES